MQFETVIATGLSPNIPVDVCYIKTESKPLVVHVLRCGCINHPKYRVAALAEQIHDQATEEQSQKQVSISKSCKDIDLMKKMNIFHQNYNFFF